MVGTVLEEQIPQIVVLIDSVKKIKTREFSISAYRIRLHNGSNGY